MTGLSPLGGKGNLAKAFRFSLSRWPIFLFPEDGRVAIDNNAAEQAMRPVGIGLKNLLFATADTGGETLARAMTPQRRCCLACGANRAFTQMQTRCEARPPSWR
jgi:hypothetical protein